MVTLLYWFISMQLLPQSHGSVWYAIAHDLLFAAILILDFCKIHFFSFLFEFYDNFSINLFFFIFWRKRPTKHPQESYEWPSISKHQTIPKVSEDMNIAIE
jgi:hypothetical protein